MAVENNVSIKCNSNLQQTGNTTKPIQYKINPNGVDKTPNKDTVQLSTAQKVGIGAGVVATAVAIFCLLRGKKPSKKVIQEAEQAIKNNTRTNNVATEVVQNTVEKPKMEMTEESKKIYDDVASKLHKKTTISSETIDKNLSSKSQNDSEDLEKLKEYFSQQSKEAAEKAAKDAEVEILKENEKIKVADTNVVKTGIENADSAPTKQVETWFDSHDHVVPYCAEGKTTVDEHHYFYGSNSLDNETLETSLQKIKIDKNQNPELYKKQYDYIVEEFNRRTKKILETNNSFTKLTPQPRDCVAYRGTYRRIGEPRQDFDVINAANIGDTIVPTRGFAYAAHRKFGTYQYLGTPYSYTGELKFEPMLIEYRIPKGSQVSSNMEHGGEVVFPGLSKFKLISRETRLIEQLEYKTGKPIGSYPYKHVVLEYIPEIAT